MPTIIIFKHLNLRITFYLSFSLAVDTLLLIKSPSDTKVKEKKANDFMENSSGGCSTGIEEEAQSLSKNLQNLKLEKDPEPIKTKKPRQKPQYKPEKWMLTGQELGLRNQLNLAIVSSLSTKCPQQRL